MKSKPKKTTIELDHTKLKSLMKITGLRSYREVVDYALTQTERAARLKKLFDAQDFYVVPHEEFIEKSYNLQKLRAKEIPKQ